MKASSGKMGRTGPPLHSKEKDMCFDAGTIKAARRLPMLSPVMLVEQAKQHRQAANEWLGIQAQAWELLKVQAKRDSFLKRDPLLRTAKRRGFAEFRKERIVARRMALDFAESRGWALSSRPFGLKALGCTGVRGNDEISDCRVLYRPDYFRCNGRPAVIAAHIANCFAEDMARCEEFAKRLGLVVEVPNYPSWDWPRGATLVLYLGPAAELVKERPDDTAPEIADRADVGREHRDPAWLAEFKRDSSRFERFERAPYQARIIQGAST